jgi:hypothetical protein
MKVTRPLGLGSPLCNAGQVWLSSSSLLALVLLFLAAGGPQSLRADSVQPKNVLVLSGFTKGTVSNGLFSHQDMLPTLVAAAGEPDIVAKCLKG